MLVFLHLQIQYSSIIFILLKRFLLRISICLMDSFPHSLVGKESTCNAGDSDLIPGSRRSPGEGIGYPLQYSGLENSMVGFSWYHIKFTNRCECIAILPIYLEKLYILHILFWSAFYFCQDFESVFQRSP